MLAILSNLGDFVKITQDKPFHFVTNLTGWCDEITGTGVLKKEFRWGTSNRVRASWIELTTTNLQNIILEPSNDLFVDFRLTLISGGPSTIESIEVNCIQSDDALDPYLGFTPILKVSEKGNISNLTKIENFTFKPYAVNPAVALYKNLAYTINQMFGHDVMYARAVPMAIGRDVTLHEWTLYDVDDPKCIKVVVPNNEFPDNKILFNPMGLDFEMPFEVHIVKAYYEELFGIGTGPQKRDIVYFPLTNRIYEIESSYLFKDFMQKEIYWKIGLKKYAPKSNRYEPQDLREQFDSITWDAEERFSEEVKLEAVKTTDPQQYDPKIGSRDYDPARLNIHDDLVIIQTKLPNYSNVLSESQYDLRSVYDSTNGNNQLAAVEYRANVSFPATDEKSLCMWFKEIKSKIAIPKDNVKGYLSLGAAGTETTPLSYSIAAKRQYEIGSYIKITRFNGLSLYGNITSVTPITGGFVYVLNVKNEIITYLNTYFANWASSFTNTGYIAESTNEQILFNGFKNGNGWKVSIYASRYIVFTDTSGIERLNILNTSLVEDYWYAIFVNISNFYRQISIDLWVRQWNDQSPQPINTTDLENIYSNTIMQVDPIDRSNLNIKYKLTGGNLVITNLRLFDKTETEQTKQSIILNQTIVQDAQYAIIIDNAIQRLKLPWIAKTK
jgi:hypothetical protein